MSKRHTPASKYTVHHAEHSAIGDYARVENNFPASQVAADPGMAELRRLFEEVNRRLATLEAEERERVAVEVEQAARLTADIQQGDPSPRKRTFLETRLKNIVAMAPDIGAVILATLANPVAGLALAIQKIAQRAQAGLSSAEPAEGA